MINWTLRRRIVASFSVVLTLLLLLGGSAFLETTQMIHSARSLQGDSLLSLERCDALASAWLERYLLAHQFALLEDRAKIELLGQQLRATRTQLDAAAAAYQETIYAEQDRDNFNKFRQAAAAYLQTEDQLIAVANSGRGAETRAALAVELTPKFADVDAAVRVIDAWNEVSANNSVQVIYLSAVIGRYVMLVLFLVILVITVLSCSSLWRAITRPLGRLLDATEKVSQGDFTQRIKLQQNDEFGTLAGAFDQMVGDLTNLVDQVQKAAIQVNTSVTQIGATASEQQATATEIAATTTEIGATSKEISATSKELVNAMSAVSDVAEQTASLAGSGQAGLSRMGDTMRNVTEAATSISVKLGVLNEKAGNINQVVTTITKVADQTNLLSLNAAIEAEKAGEAGRGFAVVATEIRRLADQTAVATYDIDQTVKEIQSAVAAGVMSMDKFSEQVRRGMLEMQQVGEQLSQIIRQVQALAPRFVAVNDGMQAQATGAEQISNALTQLTEASQQTVQSLRQSREAIGGLNQVASGLRGAVTRFRLA